VVSNSSIPCSSISAAYSLLTMTFIIRAA
jgi:hypothetical protein